jgi:hypothetical protein
MNADVQQEYYSLSGIQDRRSHHAWKLSSEKTIPLQVNYPNSYTSRGVEGAEID